MGKISSMKVIFGNGNKSVFKPGDVVAGTVLLTVKKAIKIKMVVVKVYGYCKTKWIVSGGNNNDKHYKGKEEYIVKQFAIWKGESNHSILLESGNHEKPFSFPLPRNAPSSFSSKHGSLAYSLTVTCVCTGLSSNKEFVRPFRVYDVVDLSSDPLTAELFFVPLRLSRRFEDACCFCFCRSNISVNISLDQKAYSPGDKIMLDGYIDNQSNGKYSLFLRLMQQVTCYGKRTSSSRLKSKVKIVPVCQWKSLSIAKLTKKTFRNTPAITIPSLVASKLRNCRLIDVVYYLKVKLVTSEFLSSDIEFGQYDIMIGHKGQVTDNNLALNVVPFGNMPAQPTAPPLDAGVSFPFYHDGIIPEGCAPPSYLDATAPSRSLHEDPDCFSGGFPVAGDWGGGVSFGGSGGFGGGGDSGGGDCGGGGGCGGGGDCGGGD